jgi:hypothetical protein
MSCPLTQNYVNKDCKSVAGVKKFYITQFANLLSTTVVANVITVITKSVSVVWNTYAQESEIANWDYTGTGSLANGTYAYDFNVTMKCMGLNTLDSQEFETLLKNKLVLIAEMENGDFWMLGKDYGCSVDNTKFETGTAFGDFIGSTIAIKGRSNTSMLKVDPTIIAGLLV